jgi:hypothetical protein
MSAVLRSSVLIKVKMLEMNTAFWRTWVELLFFPFFTIRQLSGWIFLDSSLSCNGTNHLTNKTWNERYSPKKTHSFQIFLRDVSYIIYIENYDSTVQTSWALGTDSAVKISFLFKGSDISLLKMTVFWDVAPCSVVEIDRRFRGAYCLHHQGD